MLGKTEMKGPKFCHSVEMRDSESTFDPSPFSAQEIQIEKPALGREPWINHIKNLHPAQLVWLSVHQPMN